MRLKTSHFIVLCLFLLTVPTVLLARDGPASVREYQIKAAFLYNFINFVDWPKEKATGSDNPITIGIIGKDPFGRAFEPLENKQVKGQKVLIKRFQNLEELKQSSEQIESLRKCYLLFICYSERKKLSEIINLVKDHSVLIVGDMKDFLESGGIINFLMEDKKVRFEINNTAAKQAELKIRSKLLRLAKRVIEEKPSEDPKK